MFPLLNFHICKLNSACVWIFSSHTAQLHQKIWSEWRYKKKWKVLPWEVVCSCHEYSFKWLIPIPVVPKVFSFSVLQSVCSVFLFKIFLGPIFENFTWHILPSINEVTFLTCDEYNYHSKYNFYNSLLIMGKTDSSKIWKSKCPIH